MITNNQKSLINKKMCLLKQGFKVFCRFKIKIMMLVLVIDRMRMFMYKVFLVQS